MSLALGSAITMGSSRPSTLRLRRKAAQLLAAAHEGLDGAASELFELYRPYLLAVANREIEPALRAKAGGSDLVQETILRAMKRIGEMPRVEPEFRAWLRQQLVRRVGALRKRYRRTQKRQIARERRMEEVDIEDYLKSIACPAEHTPGSQAAAKEERERVEQALKRLSPAHRRVIRWHARDGLSYQQIAEKIDRSPDAVRMLWNRAVKELTKVLSAVDGG
jgi:RNA polymerase sigma-70 factor (ECF subfamily)